MLRSDPLGNRLITRAADHIQSAIALLTHERDSRPAPEWPEGWSVREAIADLCADQRRGGAEECYQEAIKRGWQPTTSNSLFIPFTRIMTVASAAQGGNIVPTALLPTADALRAFPVFSVLPLTEINAPFGGNVSLPRITGPATAYSLPTESTQVTASTLTVGMVQATPKHIGVYSEMSRQVLLNTGDRAESVVVNDLRAVLGREVERQIVFGAGAGGEIAGLKTMSGVQSWSISSFNLASALTAATNAGDGLDDSFGFAAARAVGITLRGRQEFSGSSLTCWRGSPVAGTVADLLAASSSGITANHMVAGPWRQYMLVAWGGGIEVNVNPYSDFKAGIVGVRALGMFDGAPVWPATFSIGTNFS